MTGTTTRFLMTRTLVDCNLHGLVAGRFGEATPEGMCKRYKYYIKYCCGLKCTNEEPTSLLTALNLEWGKEVEEKRKNRPKSDSREILESWSR